MSTDRGTQRTPAERWVLTLNQRAVGSTPTRPTKFFNHFHILLLDYVNLVPRFGAKFFNLRIQQVHKPLVSARQPLGVVIERGRRLSMSELRGHVEQRHIAGQQKRRKRMPQIVRDKAWQFGSTYDLFEEITVPSLSASVTNPPSRPANNQ